MLNGVKHLRCVHVDVHEILRFCSGWHYTIIINLWQWITPLSYEKVLNYAIPWGIGLRGAVQLFSFTYAFAWNSPCIYIYFLCKTLRFTGDGDKMTIIKNWFCSLTWWERECNNNIYYIYNMYIIYIVYIIISLFLISGVFYKSYCHLSPSPFL